jgi:hypothetical protein
MKPITEDPQLEEELQELYILSKHWISDIHFEEVEIKFLKNILNKYLVSETTHEQLDEIRGFNESLTLQDASIDAMKEKISELLRFLGSIIIGSDPQIRLDLVEKFAVLETEMKALFVSVKQLKKSLFSFTEEIMKTECAVSSHKIN